VIRHGTALMVGFIGSGLIALPAWLRPLLEPRYAQALNAVTSQLAQPTTYEHLAIVFFGCCILYASFLAWNEERDEVEGLLQKQSDFDAMVTIIGTPEWTKRRGNHAAIEFRMINQGSVALEHISVECGTYLEPARLSETILQKWVQVIGHLGPKQEHTVLVPIDLAKAPEPAPDDELPNVSSEITVFYSNPHTHKNFRKDECILSNVRDTKHLRVIWRRSPVVVEKLPRLVKPS
jgi:hypothetical protein